MNCLAALIGPTVCELEGPIPIENNCKTDIATGVSSSCKAED